MRLPGSMLVLAASPLAASVLIALACSGSSSRTASPPQGQPGASQPAVGAGNINSDAAFCAADRQYRERCWQQDTYASSQAPFSYTQADHDRCMEQACERRVLFGQQAADALNNCVLQRPCRTSQDGCYTTILGLRASTPPVIEAYSRCAPFEQRCGAIATGAGKSALCAEIAQLDVNLQLASCFELPCGLGQQCAAGRVTNALQSCTAVH